jgi:pimeloyl-ACP methyl ester carboxylesterase
MSPGRQIIPRIDAPVVHHRRPRSGERTVAQSGLFRGDPHPGAWLSRWACSRRAVVVLATAACAQQRTVSPSPATVLEDVVFSSYSPLSRTAEIARRTLPPLTVRRGEEAFAARGERFQEQPVDLSKEKFTLYVPGGAPPGEGYGVLVFVAPWAEPTRALRWQLPLNRHRLIFVSASNSGNDASVLDRRLPLALLGYENVRLRYPIDPKRVYIGGLSGGSRVAEITALAYPDVFRGALLNAGSDPIGPQSGIYLPPADLFEKFQKTRIVFATGEKDELNLRDDGATRASLKEWCVFDVAVKTARGLAHEPLDAPGLERALSALDEHSATDPDERARCIERIQRELGARLEEAAAAIARRDRPRARELLAAISHRYGGLAGRAVLDLDARLAHN